MVETFLISILVLILCSSKARQLDLMAYSRPLALFALILFPLWVSILAITISSNSINNIILGTTRSKRLQFTCPYDLVDPASPCNADEGRCFYREGHYFNEIKNTHCTALIAVAVITYRTYNPIAPFATALLLQILHVDCITYCHNVEILQYYADIRIQDKVCVH